MDAVSARSLRELAARLPGDPAQLRAVEALQRCADVGGLQEPALQRAEKLINHPDIPAGVYMYGGVGRGKSFLMDCFFNAVPIRARRGCTFTSSCARCTASWRLQGTVNPLDELGRRIAQALQADLLRRVPRRRHHRRHDPAPPAGGAVRQRRGLCHHLQLQPDELYPDGLHRDRILPAIACSTSAWR
jgi:cell division protein ZapE